MKFFNSPWFAFPAMVLMLILFMLIGFHFENVAASTNITVKSVSPVEGIQ